MRTLVAGLISGLVLTLAVPVAAAPAKGKPAAKKVVAPAAEAAPAEAAPAPKPPETQALPDLELETPAPAAPPPAPVAAEPAPKPAEPAPAAAPTPAPTPELAKPVEPAPVEHPVPTIGQSAATGPVVRIDATAEKPAEVPPGKPAVYTPTIGEVPPLELGELPPATETATPFRYALHGFLRAGFDWIDRDEGSFTVGQNSGFRLYNARFGLQGGYGDRVKFDFSLDASQDLQSSTNQAPITLGFRDAFVAYDFGSAYVKVGQFKTPFNGESLLSDADVPFARRSIVSEGLRGDESRIAYGAFGLDRQLGVMAGASLSLGKATAALDVAAVNGNGANQGRNDNRLPALVGRASIGRGGSGLGVSGLWNDRTAGRLGNLQDERDLAVDVDGTVAVGGLRVFGMYAFQRTTFLTTTAQEPKLSWAAVGSAAYGVELGTVKLEPAYRIAVFSPTNLVPDAALLDQTFGANIYPSSSLPLRVQLNYTLRLERVARTAPNNLAEAVVQANF